MRRATPPGYHGGGYHGAAAWIRRGARSAPQWSSPFAAPPTTCCARSSATSQASSSAPRHVPAPACRPGCSSQRKRSTTAPCRPSVAAAGMAACASGWSRSRKLGGAVGVGANRSAAAAALSVGANRSAAAAAVSTGANRSAAEAAVSPPGSSRPEAGEPVEGGPRPPSGMPTSCPNGSQGTGPAGGSCFRCCNRCRSTRSLRPGSSACSSWVSWAGCHGSSGAKSGVVSIGCSGVSSPTPPPLTAECARSSCASACQTSRLEPAASSSEPPPIQTREEHTAAAGIAISRTRHHGARRGANSRVGRCK